MKLKQILMLMVLISMAVLKTSAQELPIWNAPDDGQKIPDWLITPPPSKAGIYKSKDNKDIILDNGLLKRTFRISPNLACTEFKNLSSGQQLLRAVGPEAKLIIDGKKYNVGGLYGQKEKAYLKTEWIDQFTANQADFQFKSYTVNPISPYINWKPGSFWVANKKQPAGKVLTLMFESNLPELKGITVEVNYELYDGIPLVCKWLHIVNKTNRVVKLNKVTNEVLNVAEEESSVDGNPALWRKPHGLYVESNYAYNNAMNAKMSDQTTHWLPDSTYTSQVKYDLDMPCVLEVYPPVGPGVELAPGADLKSIRTNELLMDSYDRDRNGLALRKMYYTIAPWATQNPIYMFAKSFDKATIKQSIDQCAEVGFEMIVVGMWTNFMEDTSANNIKAWKDMADYAHSKNIKIGGYSLLSSRKISAEDDVIDPKTGKPNTAAKYGGAPCLGSKWGLGYFERIKTFYTKTGFDEFDQDGAYVGDLCASTTHPGHKNVDDSQWAQIELQKGLYRWFAERGTFVNSPDWYFMDGVSKCALGYREVNFSLPREQQIVLNRQNIYDATWEKMPSMGWGFVPLSEYHGGGAAATLEPMSEHLDAYEQLMMQYFGSGVQACYLGNRLYDKEISKKLVINVVNWYKKYRSILNAQIVHLRRADGKDWDGILHVDPAGKEKGLAMLYNSFNEPIKRKIKLPLYYTGLTASASIREKEGKAKHYILDREYNAEIEVTIPANGYTWLVIE